MRRRVLMSLAVAPAVLVLGSLGYMLVERWSFLDSVYMTVLTVWTVGFQEVHPLSSQGRIFTVVLILLGVGGLAFAVGTFVEFMVEGHLSDLLEERRMKKRIDGLSGHHLICGLGRVGTVVARALVDEGAEFVVIDRDTESIAAAHREGWMHVHGDATEEEVLLEAGIDRAATLVTTLDTDADNTFVTLTARTLNPDIFVVARSSSSSSEGKLRKAGADRVITPSVIGGRRMASMVLHPVVADYLDIISHGGDVEFRLEELGIPAGSSFDGRTIGDLRIRHETGAFVLAVRGADGVVNANPWADTMMRAGDRMVVFGTPGQLRVLKGLL